MIPPAQHFTSWESHEQYEKANQLYFKFSKKYRREKLWYRKNIWRYVWQLNKFSRRHTATDSKRRAKLKQNRNQLRQIIIKLLITKDKEKLLKASSEIIYNQDNDLSDYVIFIRNYGGQKKVTFLKCQKKRSTQNSVSKYALIMKVKWHSQMKVE